MSSVVMAVAAAAPSTQDDSLSRPGGEGIALPLVADADPEFDRMEHDLRRREARWPVLISIVVIVALSAGLWLGIWTLGARIVAAF